MRHDWLEDTESDSLCHTSIRRQHIRIVVRPSLEVLETSLC